MNLETSGSASSPADGPRPGIWRAVVLALVLAPFHTYWLINLEIVRGTGFSSTISLYFNVILTLVALAAVNVPLRRYCPRWALTRAELITVYAMLSMVTSLCSIDMLEPLVCLMPYAAWNASPENHWEQLFLKNLPHGWTVSDPVALKGFYEGGTSLYRPEFLLVWLKPVALWLLFITALALVMLCLNSIIRRRWMDQERLTYPIAILPFELTNPTAAIFRQRWLWIGFAVAGAYDMTNGLHSLWPAIPTLNFQTFEWSPYLKSRPWSAIGWTPCTLFPFAIGLGYLLPREITFSFWFFFIVWKLESVFCQAVGLPLGRHQWPFLDEQAFGCYAAIVLYALWAMRGHLRHVAQSVLTAAKAEPGDPLSYRWAVIGMAAGLVVMVVFMIAGGLPLWAATAYCALYFLIALAVTRMRAQFGPPTHDLHFVGPDQTLTTVLGTRIFGPRALTAFTYLYAFNRAYRSHPMPHQLETLRVCQRSGTNSHGIALAMLLAVVWGTLAHFGSYLHIAYNLGANAKMTGWGTYGYGVEAFARLQNWITTPTGPKPQVSGAIGWGLLSTLGLMLLQARYVWLPLHPLGYAISNGWSASWTYSSLFVAWLLKTIITRYWGHKGYLGAVPFFMGLVLGEFVVGGLWTVVGMLAGTQTFSFWKG
jgi:hypothetical protein